MFILVTCLLYALVKSAETQLVPEKLPSATENICTIKDVNHASLTVDGYLALCFESDCDLASVTDVLAINYGTNQTIKMTHSTEYPRLYYSKLSSYIAASPMLVQVTYPQYSFKGFVPVSLYRTPCLITGNIAAGTYQQTLYIYPRNFSISKDSQQIYCDTYLEPHIAVSMGGTTLNCVYHEYYYSCALSGSSVTGDISIASIYSASPITIKSSDVKSFTKLCFTENQNTNDESSYSFYASLYNKSNQTTVVVRHPYLSSAASSANNDCLPLAYNCAYDGMPMNRFSYHLTAMYTGKKPVNGNIDPVTITCYLNSTLKMDRTINNIPVKEEYLCFHSFIVTEKAMDTSVTSLDDMFVISNMNIELTPFLINIQDNEKTCTLLPNTYLKMNTTIFQKNYTNYAFNYQMDSTGQKNVSLIALTNIYLDITHLYMLLPQYISDSDSGDVTLDTYQGVPIFDFLSYITDNCYATDEVCYYCIDNVLYVSTQNYCNPPHPPDSLNISLYDASGSSSELKLNKYSTVAGQNYIHNYTEAGNNEVCTAKPYFSIDQYQYAGVYLFINDKFPINMAIQLTNTYCSLMDPAFNYQAQLFETTLYFEGLCKLDGYCFEDVHSYAHQPLKLIGTTEDTNPVIKTPTYKYSVSSIIGSDMPYLIGLRKCIRPDEITKSNLDTLSMVLPRFYDYHYLYFQSPMAYTINWNNQTRPLVLNYTRSCIEAPNYSNASWYVEMIEASDWGILVLGITGNICSSNGIDVMITFFAVYTDTTTQQSVEQPVLTGFMTMVDTSSASHKYHIKDSNLWSSYLSLRDKPDATFYANLTFKYTFFTEKKYYIPVSRVTEPCIVRTLTTRLLEIDYSTSILETYNQEGCYMLSDYVYLVLPATSSSAQAKLIETNMKDIVILEELLLNSFYSLEDVWAFLDSTNIIDIAAAIEWSESNIPRLQLKTAHTRTSEAWGRYPSSDPISENTTTFEAEITTMFNMRHSSIDTHALAPILYKYWRLAISTLPLVDINNATIKGSDMPKIPLPLTLKLSAVRASIPDYSSFPTLTEQLKKDLNTEMSTTIITNQNKYNVSGLLNSKVISFSIGKTIYYNVTPLSFYQYNNFIMLVITLGNSTNKKSHIDDDILIMQSPIYTPFLLSSDTFDTQVEVVDDYLTVYCSSCILYDQVIYVNNLNLIKLISRSNVQSLPVYLSTRSSVSAVRYNYSYTFRVGASVTASDLSFYFPIYAKNMSLPTQFITNVCFITGYIKAYLKSNRLFVLFDLVDCVDMRPDSIFFTLRIKSSVDSELVTQLGIGNKILHSFNENENWVSYEHLFYKDVDVNTDLLERLASNSTLEVVLRALISNTVVTRVVPMDTSSYSIEEQYWLIYLVVWIDIVAILSVCTWVIIRTYRRRHLRKELIDLANYELSKNPILYKCTEDSFPKYMNGCGINHPMLALYVLSKKNWSVEDIARVCKTTPKIIDAWKESVKSFLDGHEKDSRRRKSVLEKMKQKLMVEERRKNMKSKVPAQHMKKNKKEDMSSKTCSTDKLLSTDSGIVPAHSQL